MIVLRCPQCGGQIGPAEIGADGRTAVCAYCGSRILLDGSEAGLSSPAGPRGQAVLNGVVLPAEEMAEIDGMLERLDRLAAIRRLRRLTGAGLQETNEFLDRLEKA